MSEILLENNTDLNAQEVRVLIINGKTECRRDEKKCAIVLPSAEFVLTR